MATPNGVRQSGEHSAGGDAAPVTYAHFNSFAADIKEKIDQIVSGVDRANGQLSEGALRFQKLELDLKGIDDRARRLEQRVDDSSGKIKVLDEDKRLREALKEAADNQGKPKRAIAESVLSAVITAIVLVIGAVFYNAWRDAALDERFRERATREAPASKPPVKTPDEPTPAVPR